MKITLLPILSILILSCKGNNPSSYNADFGLYQRDTIDLLQDKYAIMDTLYMNVIISDCGEWGGPKEEYKIYTTDKAYALAYKKFKYKCDSLEKYYGKQYVIDKKQSLILTKEDTRLISGLFIELMNEKIGTVPLPSHAANTFVLHDSDSTLFINAFTDSKKLENKYLHMKHKLGL